MTETAWRSPAPHTIEGERAYGAAVYWLLHYRTPEEKIYAEGLSKLAPGTLAGRQVRNLPEARRVYLALCKEHGTKLEALEEGELTPAEAAMIFDPRPLRTPL